MSKKYRFLSFARNLSNKHEKKLLDTVTKTDLDSLKLLQKVVHKTAGAIVKRKPMLDENSRNFEEIFFPLEKRQEIYENC